MQGQLIRRQEVSTGDFTISAPFQRDLRRPPHILLVEDDADSRDMYALFFAMSGFRVSEAEDAAVAMECIVAACPDVAVIDIALPRTDGIELCRSIRHHARDNAPALVAITGLSLGDSEIDRIRDVGLDALLFKPCLPDRLAMEVGRALVRSAGLREDARVLCQRAQATVQESARVLEKSSRLYDWAQRLRRRPT